MEGNQRKARIKDNRGTCENPQENPCENPHRQKPKLRINTNTKMEKDIKRRMRNVTGLLDCGSFSEQGMCSTFVYFKTVCFYSLLT